MFDEAVNAYNEKQKRSERRIDDYFIKLFGKHNDDEILTNDNKQQSFYEYVQSIFPDDFQVDTDKALNEMKRNKFTGVDLPESAGQ